jgi:hypothetical protein
MMDRPLLWIDTIIHPRENLKINTVSGGHEHIIGILHLLVYNILRGFKIRPSNVVAYLGNQDSSGRTLEDVNHIPEIHIRSPYLVHSLLTHRIQILQSSNPPTTISRGLRRAAFAFPFTYTACGVKLECTIMADSCRNCRAFVSEERPL